MRMNDAKIDMIFPSVRRTAASGSGYPDIGQSCKPHDAEDSAGTEVNRLIISATELYTRRVLLEESGQGGRGQTNQAAGIEF